ncbi:MAG: hypothetical protein HC831_15570, partial [Chloroflexia bacterium]|nr:hypothetical protein [Chloroflexia bacterium]
GCIIYLYHHFYSRENVQTISEGIKETVNKNYQTKKLEDKLNFSDSVQNKARLADNYLKTGEYTKAIALYDSCLQGVDKNNTDTIQKIIRCYYLIEDYEKAVSWGNQIKNNREFIATDGHVAFAWSLFHLNNLEEAEENFIQMDCSYTNFSQRIEYARFLDKIEKKEAAREKLQELLAEYSHIGSAQKKYYRGVKG